MNWTFTTPDAAVVLNVVAKDGGGALAGTLAFSGESFDVSGNWAAWDSILGRNYSAFSLCGRSDASDDVPDFISGSGILSDDLRITIQLTTSSDRDGKRRTYSGALVSSQAGPQDALRARYFMQMLKRSKQLAHAISLDMPDFA